MSEIRASGGKEAQVSVVSGDISPHLVAQKVGEATIYFRVSSEALTVANESELRAVAAANTNVFDEAAKIVGEGVKIIRAKFSELTDALKPSALEVEISFGFEVKGKASC